jgi:archaellum component FlaC
MTDNKQFDDLKKQAERLNRQLESLGGTAAKNLDDFIKGFGGGIDGASKAINNIRDQINGLDTDVNYLANSLRKVTKELSGQTTSNKDIEKSYKKLSSLSNQLYNDQNGLNTLSEKELKNIKKKIDLEGGVLRKALEDNQDIEKNLSKIVAEKAKRENNLLKTIERREKKGLSTKKQEAEYRSITDELNKQRKELERITATNTETEDFLDGELKSFDSLAEATQTRLAEEQKINRTLGTSGKIVDGIVGSLGKLGISSDFFAELKEDMRDVAKLGDKWKVITAATKGLMSGIGDALKDPVTQLLLAKKAFDFFLNAAFKANKESVNLSKNLGYGAENADRVRAGFANIERTSNNLNVNTANLSEAFNELSSATGFVTEYSADALETQIKLTKQLGLSGDEAAGVYELSVLSGKSSEATYQSMLKGYVNTRNSLKVGVPFKAAIAEAAKVSGQLAANMGYNAEKIVSGVVATKALGTSLEQAKSQGESLLDFQSSIENELQAELITGKQLNLEKARAAALMGDQVAVAEELAAQGMTAVEFSKMNVVAQKSYAQALGTTSDELANQLKKREVAIASGKSLAQITANEADEASERQDIQTKFNAAMEKLQSIIGNLVAGPLGTMLEMLSGVLEIINKIGPLLVGIATTFGIIKLSNMAIAAYQGFSKAALLTQISKLPALISLKATETAIAEEGAIASISGASAFSFGIGMAAIIAGIYAGVHAMKSMKDGEIDLKKGPIMQGGFGTVQINPEDEIFKKKDGNMMVGTDLFGSVTSSITPSINGPIRSASTTPSVNGPIKSASYANYKNNKQAPPLDLTPMISAINDVKSAIGHLNNKKWDVYLDSSRVGRGMVKGQTQSA